MPASTAAIPGGSAAAGAAPPADGGTVAGGRGQAAAGRELDEPFYLRQLAKERFDPHFFATVFTSGGSGAPQWLSGLIAEPGKWRFARTSATAAGAKRGQQPRRHTLQRPAGLARQLLPPCLATLAGPACLPALWDGAGWQQGDWNQQYCTPPNPAFCRRPLPGLRAGGQVQELAAAQLCHPQDPHAARAREGGARGRAARVACSLSGALKFTRSVLLRPHRQLGMQTVPATATWLLLTL